MQLGNRIIIVGCPGSGKSTLAYKLHRITGIPLIHLDNIWWKSDRSHITRDEFDFELTKIMKGERWILDGDYSRTYEKRIMHCDTVIFLDYDVETCIDGILKRVGKKRSDIPFTEKEPDHELLLKVREYREKERPILYSLFSEYHEKNVLIFRARDQSDKWLKEFDQSSMRIV